MVLLRVGRGRTRWADDACDDYGRRLKRAAPFDEVCVRPESFRGDESAVKAAEAGRLAKHIREGDRVIVLDQHGTLATTEELAEWVGEAARLGSRRMVFCIGGPYGHGPKLKQRAWKTLALSRLVLNHEVARVVLVEQLYRVSTVLWGGSYHNA